MVFLPWSDRVRAGHLLKYVVKLNEYIFFPLSLIYMHTHTHTQRKVKKMRWLEKQSVRRYYLGT